MDGASQHAARIHPGPAFLSYWRQRLAELPDIREEKVRQTRELLERNSYDSNEILEATIDRLVDDIDGRDADPV